MTDKHFVGLDVGCCKSDASHAALKCVAGGKVDNTLFASNSSVYESNFSKKSIYATTL